MSWEERQLIEKEIEGLLKAGECGLASNNEKYQCNKALFATKGFI